MRQPYRNLDIQERWDINQELFPDHVHYTVRWSPWGCMDRWVINRLVPSEAGVFQLWVKERRNLTLLTTEPAYYGGLRNTLREVVDELAHSGERLRGMIGNQECWFRFSVTPIREYLENLNVWFGREKEAYDNQNREILVREIEKWCKFPQPPPDIKTIDRERFKDSDFGPPMPFPQ